MKKSFVIILALATMLVASVSSFASITTTDNSCGGDHEGKPCHATDSRSGARCSCGSCYGNNWGNTYCTHCGHSVKMHY